MYCTCQKGDKKCMKCKEIIKQFKENRNHKDRQKLRQMLTEMCFKDIKIEERYLDDKLEIVPLKKPKINDKVYEYVYYKYKEDYENGDDSFHIYLSKDNKEYIDSSYYICNIHYSKSDIPNIDKEIQAFKTKHIRDEQIGFGVYFKSV